MSGYAIAWIIVFLAACGGAAVLYHLLRGLERQGVRILAVALTATFFLVPAPVPEHPEQLAPAFVVCIFEAFFQIDGSPQVSLRVLLVAMSVVALVTVVGRYFFTRYYTRACDTQEGPPRASEQG